MTTQPSFKLSSWMGDILPDTATLSTIIAIPGSHNSTSSKPKSLSYCFVWPWARCQSLSIEDQLMIGVRAFDVRVTNKIPDVIYTSHTFISSITFQSVLHASRQFVERYPTEVVLILVKRDWATRDFWDINASARLWDICKTMGCYLPPIPSAFPSVPISFFRGHVIVCCMEDMLWHPSALEVSPTPSEFLCFNNISDVWSCKSTSVAKRVITDRCRQRMIERKNLDSKESKINITPLDVVVVPLWPYHVSRSMNKWFRQSAFELLTSSNGSDNCRLNSNPEALFPYGIVSVDFSEQDITTTIIKLNTLNLC